jgi:hypothetical protein
MARFKITRTDDGEDFGTWESTTERDALYTMARELGLSGHDALDGLVAVDLDAAEAADYEELDAINRELDSDPAQLALNEEDAALDAAHPVSEEPAEDDFEDHEDGDPGDLDGDAQSALESVYGPEDYDCGEDF